MNTLKTKGKIFTGKRIGNKFIKIPWVKKQINKKLGFDPYPGTLNIRLPDKRAKQLKKILKESKGIKIIPAQSFLQAHCFNARIKSKIQGAIIIPKKPGYPPNTLEIIAPVYLREALSLKDGDEVEITIFLKPNTKP